MHYFSRLSLSASRGTLFGTFLCVITFFFCASILRAEGAVVSPIITFTINQSPDTVLVPAGARLELRWSTEKAASCASNWTTNVLKTSGVQTGRITRARTFVLVCTGTTGIVATSTIVVNLREQKPIPTPLGWPAIRVFTPNGDEVWYQGEVRVVSWMADVAPVLRDGFTLGLIDARGQEIALATSTLSKSTRSYTWAIPSEFPPGKYKMRISALNQTPSDMSDQFFWIAETYRGVSKPLACGSLGDVDRDEKLSTADVESIRLYSGKTSLATSSSFSRFDVDANGVISRIDAYYVEHYLAGESDTLPGCGSSGVSVDLQVNGKSDAVVSVSSVGAVTLSWSSSGAGRCLLDDVFVPANGSVKRTLNSEISTVYTITCFAPTNHISGSDEITVQIESANKTPHITFVEAPTAFQVGKTGIWRVTASDPDDTALTFSVSWGDGGTDSSIASTTRIGGGITTSFSHAYSVEGIYTVSVSAKDRRNGAVSQLIPIVVTEAPRASKALGHYQFGALFEGYRLFHPF